MSEQKLTKTEKELLKLLAVHPARPIRTGPFGSRWKIGGRVFNGPTIENAKKKGIIKHGIHPENRGYVGLVVADQVATLPGGDDQ